MDRVEPDGQQDEIAHDLSSNMSYQGSFAVGTKTYFWREAYGDEAAYFSYNLNSNADAKCLFIRYWGSDSKFTDGAITYNRDFKIYIDNVEIAAQIIDNNKPNNTYDVFYEIPENLINGKENLTVKITPNGVNKCAGKVIEVRIVTDKI